VKSMDAHTLRMLLVARSRLVSQRQATANTIRGLLKTLLPRQSLTQRRREVPFACRVTGRDEETALSRTKKQHFANGVAPAC